MCTNLAQEKFSTMVLKWQNLCVSSRVAFLPENALVLMSGILVPTPSPDRSVNKTNSHNIGTLLHCSIFYYLTER